MLRHLFLSALIFLYGIFVETLFLMISLVALISANLKKRIGKRGLSSSQIASLILPANSAAKRVVFFCSSAGEYEQAKALAAAMSAWEPIYILFSTSGVNFANARGEAGIFFLSPPDSSWRWSRLFRAVRPRLFVVVRHELWPGFLWAARRLAPIYLINAALPSSSSSKKMPFVKALLLRPIRRIFTVDESSTVYFAKLAGRSRVSMVGDTKYDQVVTRLKKAQSEVVDRRGPVVVRPMVGVRTLIMGSAWEADAKCMADGLSSLPPSIRWRLIVVPHEVKAENIRSIQIILSRLGKPIVRWSDYRQDDPFDILLVDKIGLLSEMYSVADQAFVGGAMHYRVHNVLEPACYGVPIAHGPLFETSTEARRLVALGLSRVVQSSADVSAWVEQGATGGLPPKERLVRAVLDLCGASEKIAEECHRL